MTQIVRRTFVEKKKSFDVQAQKLFVDLKDNLGITGLKSVRIINRYDIEGLLEDEYKIAKNTILSEPNVDLVYDEYLDINNEDKVFAIEYLPGQYDARADAASQCIQILTGKNRPYVKVAQIIVLSGKITDLEFDKIKEYLINPVESREASLYKPESLENKTTVPPDVKIIKGFTQMSESLLCEFHKELGLAMSFDDLKFCQKYFRESEKRDPTITEMRVLDTYWSDHCRHSTFLTRIEDVEFDNGELSDVVKSAYQSYLESRKYVYSGTKKDICLMDIAVLAMKELRKKGKLDDLELSDEINACSIIVNAEIDGKNEEWLVMFKNETHNHPTEIEPFGGAATCIGGAIRDPLSGRSYVYQAMRVTGSGDPRTPVEDTLPGKLPQRKITTGAASGYSSYGNQIGLPAGQVSEVYDENFVAKRMELGAVIAAAPRKNVKREKPVKGDVIILLGGKTGRDGCGGATGSSKEHTEESLVTGGAEVQKGNPVIERKIQRLFRKPEVSILIKKCNDFGAGGVSVAIGELADGLNIDLDAVPKKYEGLDGTELAISESQERMAVLVSKEDLEEFIKQAAVENLEAVKVAEVIEEPRLKIYWRKKAIVDISRAFLDTNGVGQSTKVSYKSPILDQSPFNQPVEGAVENPDDLHTTWINNLKKLNVCSQKGLVEMFDSTIGAATVSMPLGGTYQLSPQEGMAAKLPVLKGNTNTGTLMSYGYYPSMAKWSPFHGAVYAVVHSIAKIAAMGGNYKNIRLTFQEYFEKLGDDPVKWSKPFSALLGAFLVQKKLEIPSIGGKDSMSGTFLDLSVPPTLVSFAVNTTDVRKVISTEFKKAGSHVVLLPLRRDNNEIPYLDQLDKNYTKIYELNNNGKILAASTVKEGGLCEAVSKMCFGNKIGFDFSKDIDRNQLFKPDIGSIVVEIDRSESIKELFSGLEYIVLGNTTDDEVIKICGVEINLDEAISAWESTLEQIFPTRVSDDRQYSYNYMFNKRGKAKTTPSIAKPVVFIPVFPGTNCEYDTQRAFLKAGAITDILVIKNLNPKDIEESIGIMVEKINNAQIIMIPGGFSGGDDPDGSGKFIATAFRNSYISDAIMKLLKQRDGLILGICNGFQALIKTGLVPYGEIRDIDLESPTLTFNTIGRHMSCMVNTKVVSSLSPWLWKVKTGDMHTIAVSHGEGRFVASDEVIQSLVKNGQIATQYVDLDGNPTYDIRFNPNGSTWAVEGITSLDGRVFGKMGHSERIGSNVAVNVPGEKDQKIFESGVEYFK